MAQTTPQYNLPYPELADTPNGPAAFQDLATTLDTLLGGFDTRIRIPRIVCGGVNVNGQTGPRTFTVGFTPQVVKFTCQNLVPPATSGATATLSIGRLGLGAGGAVVQFLTGIRIDHTSSATNPISAVDVNNAGFFERRTVESRCVGVIVDDSTITGAATGSFTSNGFVLNFADTSGSTNIYYYEAFE